SAVTAAMLRERRLEELGGHDRHLLDHLPADLILGCARQLIEQSLDARAPIADVLLEDRDRDHGIAGRSHRTVRDRVFELLDIGRVVPEAGRCRLRHLVQRTLVRRLASRYHRVTTTFLRVYKSIRSLPWT